MDYFVYILYSQEHDRYYIGHSKDINRRIAEHNIRKNLGASDWELKYSELFDNRSGAMQREAAIKKMKSRKYIETLIVGT